LFGKQFTGRRQKTAGIAMSRDISKSIAQAALSRAAPNAIKLDTTLDNATTESVEGTKALKNVEKPL